MTNRSKLPPTVYLLGLTIFTLVTAEFMVAGMMPALADSFSVSLAQVGNLIAFYALGMALGGPPVMVLLVSRSIGNNACTHRAIGCVCCCRSTGISGAKLRNPAVGQSHHGRGQRRLYRIVHDDMRRACTA
ncbi:hypothetical protein [Pseudomonas cichorii]|uniref:hypothetical protein n=1 Tax=Pseudomonas cichorii TaxID=36746 RepID=UPI003908BADB